MMPVAAMNFCQWTGDFLLPPSDARWIDEATWAAAEAGFNGKTTSEEGDEDGAAEIVGDGKAALKVVGMQWLYRCWMPSIWPLRSLPSFLLAGQWQIQQGQRCLPQP